MAESKPRSFWGRVTEFVKNPTQDWSLTRHENALRDQQEQERLRAKEEQRRLDGFIRRRELASLRRLRKRQADGLPIEGAYTDVPDTGSGPSAPEREATLRKINEIEQAMSGDAKPAPAARGGAKTYLHSRPRTGAESLAAEAGAIRLGGELAGQGKAPANPDGPLAFPVTDMAAREATAPAPTQHAPTVIELQPTLAAPTQLAASRMGAGPMSTPEPTQMAAGAPAPAAQGTEPWTRAQDRYATSNLMAVDVQEGVSSSPLFDQACIDFANAHDEDAERALLDAISGSPERELENEFWLALFDLYRASGNQPRFDALVADYVDRFQSSAPSWDNHGPRRAGAAAPSAPAGGNAASFTALGEFDAMQARALLVLARSNAPQVALDFSALTSIAAGAQATALEALRMFNAAASSRIEMTGLQTVIDACTAAAPPMQRELDPSWWHLRLEALRLAGAQDLFDNAALDFCVTYEISPPTWEPSRAKVTLVQADGNGGPRSTMLQAPPTVGGSSQFSTGFGHTSANVAVAALQGDIKGGSEDFLKPLDRAVEGKAGIIVNLQGLRRLDFASAGIVLNWVVAQANAGRSVSFEGTHRLIAGLFVILGINSVAHIQLRKS